jgi:aminoglycoside 3-N-acetyltransferase I
MSQTGEYSFAQLTASDVTLLKDLLRVFGEAFEDVETYQGAVPPDDYLHSLLAMPHFIVIVARQHGEVIGGLAAYELQKFERNRREIYIYDLAVAKDHRRHHVATGAINELKRVARSRGAYVIYVQADRGDAPAIALYESLGRREDVFHFDIDVDRDESASDRQRESGRGL